MKQQAGRLQSSIPKSIPGATVEVKAGMPGQMRIFRDGELVWAYKGKKLSDAELISLLATK